MWVVPRKSQPKYHFFKLVRHRFFIISILAPCSRGKWCSLVVSRWLYSNFSREIRWHRPIFDSGCPNLSLGAVKITERAPFLKSLFLPIFMNKVSIHMFLRTLNLMETWNFQKYEVLYQILHFQNGGHLRISIDNILKTNRLIKIIFTSTPMFSTSGNTMVKLFFPWWRNKACKFKMAATVEFSFGKIFLECTRFEHIFVNTF